MSSPDHTASHPTKGQSGSLEAVAPPPVSLLDPLTIRGVTLRNRIVMSPMCQYSSIDGLADDWHLVHLGSRAVGGAGLVMTEAAAIAPEGRISPGDLGIWGDEHIEMLARIARFVASQGAVPAMQLAHAGRKASCDAPWNGGAPLAAAAGAWPVVGPSAIPFSEAHPVPRQLDEAGIGAVLQGFVRAATRALDAGFQVLEIHAAHGYLLHSFLSPLSNQRTDQYGGSFDNRARLLLEVAAALRRVMPDRLPLWVRISCTDWVAEGWDIEQSVELARRLQSLGVDLIDCSSGALVPTAKIPVGPGFQVPFAAQIKRQAGILTGAVGLITEPEQANQIIATGDADVVLIAREMLREPYWADKAHLAMHAEPPWPVQYGYAVRRRASGK